MSDPSALSLRSRMREVFFRKLLAAFTAPGQRASFWEPQIRAYERADRRAPPAPGQIVFTGSSTIRLWSSLARDMAPLGVVNRGFGGAHMAHVERFLPRIVLPLRPRVVVLYAGDNDLGLTSPTTPDEVLASLGRIVATLEQALPAAHLVMLSIKPSVLRQRCWPAMQLVNAGMRELAGAGARRHYVNLAELMFDGAGALRRELLTWDGLHPSAAGYAAFTERLKPKLLALTGADGPSLGGPVL